MNRAGRENGAAAKDMSGEPFAGIATFRAPPPDLPWNKRLAPLAREIGGDDKVGDWLRIGKRNPDYYERVLLGLISLRDRHALDFLRTPGKPFVMTPGVLAVTMEGQPLEKRAIAEYWRTTSPDRTPKRQDAQRVEISVTLAEEDAR